VVSFSLDLHDEIMYWLLTLSKHKDGVWVQRLVKELEKMQVSVRIVTMEEILHEKRLDDGAAASFFAGDNVGEEACQGLINRISDASDPVMIKRCLAILTLATRIYGIPVFNGPMAFSLCSNKWCQHALFTRAGLRAPSTAVILPSQLHLEKKASESLRDKSQRLLGEPLPHLIKPNAGGFGFGIQRLDNNTNEEENISSLCSVLDDTVLVQRYVPPADGIVYRVWFLVGKVQCAVRRFSPNSTATAVRNNDEFQNGCSAGSMACTRPNNNATPLDVTAWPVPPGVLDEIESLLALLEDAHAGSIEFLVDARTDERLYFDLNLLSTLPTSNKEIQNAQEVWGANYNPWAELAGTVVRVLTR
jgi:glutathione synthase/RimK-type ligase-like ATP-grasp enzyme